MDRVSDLIAEFPVEFKFWSIYGAFCTHIPTEPVIPITQPDLI